MAQTELMLRLVKDGKIVGYENRTTTGSRTPLMGIHHKRYIIDSGRDVAKYLNDRVNYIEHDSFELGIKVGDEWWFEGDIVKTDEAGWVGHIVFDGWNFSVEDDIGGFILDCNWNRFKRIGNIHEVRK